MKRLIAPLVLVLAVVTALVLTAGDDDTAPSPRRFRSYDPAPGRRRGLRARPARGGAATDPAVVLGAVVPGLQRGGARDRALAAAGKAT